MVVVMARDLRAGLHRTQSFGSDQKSTTCTDLSDRTPECDRGYRPESRTI